MNVPAENADLLSQAILKLKANPAQCLAMGKKARAVAEEKYDRKTSYLGIIQLADRLLEKAHCREKTLR